MITMLISVATVFMFLGIKNSKNPMKMSFLILGGAALMLLMSSKETGSIWHPLIFFILFTGGILMMFMILSSILPNEKAYKTKLPKSILILIMVFLIPLNSKEMLSQSNFMNIKSLISSSFFMLLMTIIILIYFFNSMSLNSSEEYSMRSFQCCYSNNFVNY